MNMQGPGDVGASPVVVHSFEGGTNVDKGTCSVVVCERPAKHRGGMCNGHASWSYYHGGQVPTHQLWPRGNPAEVIRRASVVDAATGCWNWAQSRDSKGYGYCMDKTTGERRAHRVAWATFRGPIPEGMSIDHLCGNTSCVNVEHMDVVTRGENSRRRWTRAGYPLKPHCATCSCRGEA